MSSVTGRPLSACGAGWLLNSVKTPCPCGLVACVERYLKCYSGEYTSPAQCFPVRPRTPAQQLGEGVQNKCTGQAASTFPNVTALLASDPSYPPLGGVEVRRGLFLPEKGTGYLQTGAIFISGRSLLLDTGTLSRTGLGYSLVFRKNLGEVRLTSASKAVRGLAEFVGLVVSD